MRAQFKEISIDHHALARDPRRTMFAARIHGRVNFGKGMPKK
jgi:hypothetical protein